MTINYAKVKEQLGANQALFDVFEGGFNSFEGHAIRIFVAAELGKESTEAERQKEWPEAIKFFQSLSSTEVVNFYRKHYRAALK